MSRAGYAYFERGDCKDETDSGGIGQLNGEFGPATQKAMRILTSIGDIYGAERMARTEHVHVASGTVISTGTGGAQFIEWMAENGGRARCYATVNPSAIDSTHWKRLGIPREYYDWQLRLNRAYETMGIITAYSCTPYLVGNVPHFGELMCSAESSAIPMYNGYFAQGQTGRAIPPPCPPR